MSIFGGFFWGIFLLAAGLIVMLKLVFNLQVSAGRMIFGLFILMVGVSLLIGNPGWGSFHYNDANTTVFSSSPEDISVANSNDYLDVFGSVTYDTSKLGPGQSASIKCIFGSCRIILPEGASAVKVTAHTAFGNMHLPNGQELVFGTNTYERPGDNAISIDVSCAFGSVDVTEND